MTRKNIIGTRPIKCIKYLRDKEWSMGNGQCDECCGGEPGKWFPHPCYDSEDEEGHQPDCILAQCLEELGETVVYAKKTRKAKHDKRKEEWMEFYLMTIMGIPAPEGTVARDIQESYWKENPIEKKEL